MQYYNCADNYPANELIEGLKEKRHNALMKHHNKSKHCTQLLSDRKTKNSISVSVSIQQWINDTCCAEIVMNKCSLCKKKIILGETDTSVCNIPLKDSNQVCLEKDVFSLPSKLKRQSEYESCCREDYKKDLKNEDKIFYRYNLEF